MKEIKFRGMSVMKDQNQLVYGYGCYTDQNERFFIITDLPIERTYVQVKSIQQITGLKDKNGKKIYEGDIVKGSAFEDGDLQIGEIAWCGLCFEVVGIVTDGEFSELAEWSDGGNIEVIGNIYQSPELLNS